MPNTSPERIAYIRRTVENRSYPDGRLDDMLAAYDQERARLDKLMDLVKWREVSPGVLEYSFTTPRLVGRCSIDVRAAIDAATP
jgi:hypothetical protein